MPSYLTADPTLPLSGPVLPRFVQEYLQHGAPEGARNDAIYRVAQQFKAAGFPQSEAEGKIMPVAISQGGDKVTREVLAAIKNGYASTMVNEPIILRGGKGPNISSMKSSPKAPPSGNEATLAALASAFRPGERIAICEAWERESGDWSPGRATIHTLEGWQKRAALLGKSAGGCYVGINPLREGAERRLREDVAVFRHVLAEWDKDVPPDEQERRLRDSGLPISVLVSSGGRSVHAWVRVDAPDLKTWEKRRDIIFERLKCDTKNKDVSRVSRLPGFMRGDVEQKLLGVNLGAASWGEWEGGGEWVPKTWGWVDLIESGPDLPEEVIKGVLRRGCMMQIASGPKMRKSFLIADLALSVSHGLPFLGFETVKGPVFIADAENQAALIRSRLPPVAKGRGIPIDRSTNADIVISPLRGELLQKQLPEIIGGIVRAIRSMPVPPVLVIMEPIYLLFRGVKEKEAEEMTAALEEMDRVCRELGAAVVFIHHYAKGAANGKASMDRASGSGALSRYPDAIMTLTAPAPGSPPPANQQGEKEKPKPDWDAIVELDLRWFPKVEPFKVYWHDHHYSSTPGRVYVLTHRDGSMADQYGGIMSQMPRLVRNAKDPSKCPIIAYIHEKTGLGQEGAERVFDNLKKDRYQFMAFEGEGVWVGRAFSENTPF